MGKVVEGFEKQLDQLFQGDAMDITTDVAVLEQMLQKDGLSLRRDADWNLTDSKAAGIFPAAFTFLLLPDRTARTGR